MENIPKVVSLLQKKQRAIDPTPVPSPLLNNIANFKPVHGMTQSLPQTQTHLQSTIKPPVTLSKKKLPPPMQPAKKPDPEQQLKLIIQDKPPKKDVIEYLQQRANALTIEKMK